MYIERDELSRYLTLNGTEPPFAAVYKVTTKVLTRLALGHEVPSLLDPNKRAVLFDRAFLEQLTQYLIVDAGVHLALLGHIEVSLPRNPNR